MGVVPYSTSTADRYTSRGPWPEERSAWGELGEVHRISGCAFEVRLPQHPQRFQTLFWYLCLTLSSPGRDLVEHVASSKKAGVRASGSFRTAPNMSALLSICSQTIHPSHYEWCLKLGIGDGGTMSVTIPLESDKWLRKATQLLSWQKVGGGKSPNAPTERHPIKSAKLLQRRTKRFPMLAGGLRDMKKIRK